MAQLDRLLGPMPDHATLVFVNEPGVESDPFLFQSAHAQLDEGRPVVYLVVSRPPRAVMRGMMELGFQPAPGAPLHFLDAYSPTMGQDSGARWQLDGVRDLGALVATLERAAREVPGAILLVDSLSDIIDQTSFDALREANARLFAAIRSFESCHALFTRWPYEGNVDGLLREFDAQVHLAPVKDRVMLSQYFQVDRARWLSEVDGKPRLYKTIKPGGVSVYIPKIVVTGAYNAGKSSFIHSASDTAASADHLGTTVALDHGRVTMDGVTADVFGTPGQARFDPILKIVANQALGVVLVVDSTKPSSFPRARDMLDQTWRRGLPVIVAANKQDLPDALPPAEVLRLLEAPDGIQAVGCTGADRDSARQVLRALMDQILHPQEVPA